MDEFYGRAIRFIIEKELTTPEAARRLAISDKTFWPGCFRRDMGSWRGTREPSYAVTDIKPGVS